MIEIDEDAGTVTEIGNGMRRTLALGSREGFALVSRAWLRAGWDAKHVYTFTWMGRPVIQLPEDLLRVQEVIHATRPEVIVETGVAHGGSAIFYASLFEAMGRGRVVAVDIEIRPHNRTAIEAHPLFNRITLIEGDSIADETVRRVREAVGDAASVMVLLDSRHSRAHVLSELQAYAPLVTSGSYIVACDGIMRQVVGGRRTDPSWLTDNPVSAVTDFLAAHPEFRRAQPAFAFDESGACDPITYWPDGWLQRR